MPFSLVGSVFDLPPGTSPPSKLDLGPFELPPGTSPPSKLDLGPFEVHSASTPRDRIQSLRPSSPWQKYVF